MKNREIKFRAWDKNGKRMILTPQFLIADINGYVVATLDCCIKEKCENKEGCEHLEYDVSGYLDGGLYPYPAVLMQYTGLKDKNGKEIFEGDIVNHGDNYPSEVVFDDYRWELREWGYKDEGYEYRRHELISYTNPIEVIGNIYENPELLKGDYSDEKNLTEPVKYEAEEVFLNHAISDNSGRHICLNMGIWCWKHALRNPILAIKFLFKKKIHKND